MMTRIEKSILIDAPLEKVFAFMAEPNSLSHILPNLLKIRDVQPLPQGGYCYYWTYELAGKQLEGQSEWSEFVKNQRVVSKNEGDISGTIVWTYWPEANGTRVRVSVDFSLPEVVLRELAERCFLKLNEREVGSALANLKERMET